MWPASTRSTHRHCYKPDTGRTTITPDEFIHRWQHSAASERSNYALFLYELCDLLDLPHPDPAGEDTALHDYVIDRRVDFHHGDGSRSVGYIDLYKRGCFVLDAPEQCSHLLRELWLAMDHGGFSAAIRAELLRFNGSLFADPTALPLDREQIEGLLGQPSQPHQQHLERQLAMLDESQEASPFAERLGEIRAALQ